MTAPSFKNLKTKNKYWKIGALTYAVFQRQYIDTSDPDYLEWRHQGFDPIDVSDSDFRAAQQDDDLGPFSVISAVQARRAMRSLGFYAAVLSAEGSASDAIKDNWETAIPWHRMDSWVITLLTNAGLDSDYIDSIFETGAGL